MYIAIYMRYGVWSHRRLCVYLNEAGIEHAYRYTDMKMSDVCRSAFNSYMQSRYAQIHRMLCNVNFRFWL